MRDRNKDGRFVKRLQYILFFVSFVSVLYLLVIMNIFEPIPSMAYFRGNSVSNTSNLTSKKDEQLVIQGKQVTAEPFLLKISKKINWNFKVKNIAAEIGDDLVLPNSSTDSSVTTQKDVKRPDFVMPQPQGSPKYRANKSSEPISEKIAHFVPKSLKKIDWHNYEQIEYEKQRHGIGEQGKAVILDLDITRIFKPGYSIYLGDKVALNRSLPDLRDPMCHHKLYLKSLPSVSVVIPFFNERLSTLLRTIYSVVNRSPPQLLKEVLVVDDGNNGWEQKDEFYKYVADHLPKVKIIYLPHRSGLMGARMAGVRNATSDVIVVLDSHVEANVNWLPPLLEPIALDYRTVVLPHIDAIEDTNFLYRVQYGPGRGVIDWEFGHFRLPLPPKDLKKFPEPYETPVMSGGLFAISRVFMLELGGYDPGLKSWAGEQYELSFKIWQCGGRMLEAPCSRVGHLYRIQGYSAPDALRNFRRVAEVWMDEYAQYIYRRIPNLLAIDPGDLTEQRELRKRLNCKPFRWFMEQVAFDIPNRFPMVEPGPFAQGRIRPVDKPKVCADAGTGKESDTITLKKCRDGQKSQSFFFSWQKDIRMEGTKMCWTVSDPAVFEDAVHLQPCTQTSPQVWKYHPETQRITFGGFENLCLEKQRRSLFLNHCNEANSNQRWLVDHVDYERLSNWGVTTVAVTGPKETGKENGNMQQNRSHVMQV